MPDDLRVLAFDTSAAHCAAAVICGDRVLAQRVEPMAKGQAERLFPLLGEMMAQAGLSWPDLDALGVGIGPGNFTGVRISVAAARGLALSLGIPAVGVSATEAAACDATRPCRAVVALRRDEVAWEDFPAQEGALHKERPLSPGTGAATGIGNIADAGAVRDVVTGPVGTGSEYVSMRIHDPDPGGVRGGRLAEEFGTAPATRPLPLCDAQALPEAAGPKLGKPGELPSGPPVCLPVHPIAVAIARVARKRVATIRKDEAGATGDMAALPRPAPLYLRPADAAPPKDPPPLILR